MCNYFFHSTCSFHTPMHLDHSCPLATMVAKGHEWSRCRIKKDKMDGCLPEADKKIRVRNIIKE